MSFAPPSWWLSLSLFCPCACPRDPSKRLCKRIFVPARRLQKLRPTTTGILQKTAHRNTTTTLLYLAYLPLPHRRHCCLSACLPFRSLEIVSTASLAIGVCACLLRAYISRLVPVARPPYCQRHSARV
ncbi:hypothetical protein B0T17DRAFT_214622 [Bombardia bombarda]|uniref:Secreted protein n=1 Tax=Bombardia bombarda TaxID=252184 RepID=A0AA40C995_9PEZI|nr:hypothetical protein B0T17DRAFT_214622 [Bombardia bombarda]